MKKLVWLCIVITFDCADIFSADAAPMQVNAAQSSSDQPVVLDPFLKAILKLPKRTTNLMILNDTYENYAKSSKENYPFAWRDISADTVICSELLMALTDEQVVLCSKSLWLHIQFLVTMWHDVATMSYEQFYTKHHQFADMNDQTEKEFAVAQSLVAYLQDLSNLLNRAAKEAVIAQDQNKKDAWVIFDTRCAELTGFLKDPSIFKTFAQYNNFFAIDSWYQAVMASKYECRAVGDDYLLFVPISLIKDYRKKSEIFNPVLQVLQSKGSRASAKPVTALDLALGLHYSQLPIYVHKHMLSDQESRRIMMKVSSQNLVQVLQDLLIDRRSVQKEWLDYLLKLLPNFNIYISGHGTADGTIASFDYADFNTLLQVLNKQIRTKNFLFGSCCASGTSVQSLFQSSYLYHNPLLSSLTYPIMFIGIMKNSVVGAGRPIDLSKICDYASVYAGQVCAFDNENYFSTIFGLLNAKPLPSYLEAMKIFSGMFDRSNSLMLFSNVLNYVSIKLPNTEWIEPINYGKFVKKLTNVSVAASSKDIVIDPKVQIALLSAHNIDKKIVATCDIDENHLIFLPVTYDYPYFKIQKLEVINKQKSIDITLFSKEQQNKLVCRVLDSLFLRIGRQPIADEVMIFIDQANILGIEINNVLCDIQDQSIAFNVVTAEGSKFYCFKITNGSITPLVLDQQLISLLNQKLFIMQTFAARNVASGDVVDMRATVPPLQPFIQSFEQTLSQVPKMAKESRQLQQSWSQDKQLQELYDKRKIDSKKPNPHAKPFVPKGAQSVPKVAQEVLVPTENVYTKNVSDQGKVSWSAQPKA